MSSIFRYVPEGELIRIDDDIDLAPIRLDYEARVYQRAVEKARLNWHVYTDDGSYEPVPDSLSLLLYAQNGGRL